MNIHVSNELPKKINNFIKLLINSIDCEYSLNKNFEIDYDIHVVCIGKLAKHHFKTFYNKNIKYIKSAFIISKNNTSGEIIKDKRFHYYQSTHPMISDINLNNTDLFIDYLSNLTSMDKLFFIISGGTSALIEKLDPEISLEDYLLIMNDLLYGNYSIDFLNLIRSRISVIKNGKLLNYINANVINNLIFSDIPSNNMNSFEIVGSGPTIYHEYDFETADKWLRKYKLNLSKYKNSNKLHFINNYELDSPYKYIERIKNINQNQNIKICPIIHNCYCEDFFNIIDLKKFNIYIGEVTIDLNQNIKRGGRNSHMALLMSLYCIENNIKNWLVFSIASDGDDGTTGHSGAVISSSLLKKYNITINELEHSIKTFDSFSFIDKYKLSIDFESTNNITDIRGIFTDIPTL